MAIKKVRKASVSNSVELDRVELEYLKEWHQSSHRKPLLVRGARQVGKTSLVRLFCKKEKLQLVEVNLELQKSLRKSFCQMDPKRIISDLQLELGLAFSKKTLLFIDEIQTVPEAIQGLRYFYELMPELPVIAAGSLLEFVLSDHELAMPVGRVETLFLGPMRFTDFLKARKQGYLLKTVLSFDFSQVISALEHTKLLEYFLEYLQVGGMPEAVRQFVLNESYPKVRKIQRDILQSYKDDFAKYSKRIPLERIERVFLYATANIGRKVKYSEVDPNEQSKNLLLAIELLEKAGVIYRVFHSGAGGIPLELTKNSRIFKFLFMDVGLVSCSLNLDAEEINKIYFSSPTEVLLLHRGMISEQFVGQSLLHNGSNEKKSLYFWLRDETANKAEVDFLIEQGLQIFPIEVKSGKTGNIRSLVQFAKSKNHEKLKERSAIKLGTKEYSIRKTQVDSTSLTVYEVPLYLSERLWELLKDTGNY